MMQRLSLYTLAALVLATFGLAGCQPNNAPAPKAMSSTSVVSPETK